MLCCLCLHSLPKCGQRHAQHFLSVIPLNMGERTTSSFILLISMKPHDLQQENTKFICVTLPRILRLWESFKIAVGPSHRSSQMAGNWKIQSLRSPNVSFTRLQARRKPAGAGILPARRNSISRTAASPGTAEEGPAPDHPQDCPPQPPSFLDPSPHTQTTKTKYSLSSTPASYGLKDRTTNINVKCTDCFK